MARAGRFILGGVGAILIVVGILYGYTNPEAQLLLTSALLFVGIALIWISFAAPDQFCAHFGLNLPWFL